MLPRIPAPPSSGRPSGGGGGGALPASVYGAVASAASKSVSNIDALFPPIHGSTGGAGSARNTYKQSAEAAYNKKSLRLLEDIKNAAKLLAMDDLDGPTEPAQQRRTASSSSNNNNVSTARRVAAIYGSAAAAASSASAYQHPFPNGPASSSSSARRTQSSDKAGTTTRKVVASSYVLGAKHGIDNGSDGDDDVVGAEFAVGALPSARKQPPASKAAMSINARKTASGGGSDMGASSSLLIADAVAAANQSKLHQPSSARRPEPVLQRLERLEQRLLRFDQQQQMLQQPHSARTASANVLVSSSSGAGGAHAEADAANGVTSRATRGMSPTTAMNDLAHLLVPHEKEELRKGGYKQIYFAGTPELAVRRGKHASPAAFDNEHGDYKIIVGDHLAYRYEILSVLGSGSFAHVVKAMDHKHNSFVACKIVKNKKKFHEQAAIERGLLEFVNKHAGSAAHGGGAEHAAAFVRMRDSFVFRQHVVLVFDLHGMNLYDRLKSQNFASTPIALIQGYTQQLLHALEFLAHVRLVHCDLKPENILLRSSTNVNSVRLADLGSSTFEGKQVHTYICSRFYRAPEIALGVLPYTCAIDVWSLGCVLFELYTGAPLFPAQSEAELLGMITARLGPCPSNILAVASRKKHFYDAAADSAQGGQVLKKSRQSFSKMHPIRQLFPPAGRNPTNGSNPTNAVLQEMLGDLICKLVCWDPAERLTPSEALQHPFVTRCAAASGANGVPRPPQKRAL